MSPTAQIARLTLSLLLFAAAGSAVAASNTNALLGASDPGVMELNEGNLVRPVMSSVTPAAGPVASAPIGGMTPAKAAPKRIPNQQHRGFDWSTLISLSFGIVGLLWVRRRTAEL